MNQVDCSKCAWPSSGNCRTCVAEQIEKKQQEEAVLTAEHMRKAFEIRGPDVEERRRLLKHLIRETK